MKERGLTTFVEVPLEWGEENQRSECHPWSSSPNHFFFRTVCGIVPLEAGHKKVEIAPSMGEYNTLNAVYPHHLGNIEIKMEKTATALQGSITVPEGMEGTLIWNGKKTRLKPGRQEIAY
jgi:alpha-L-rhamnosidase